MSTQKEGRTQEHSGPETAGLLVADRAGQILFCNGDAEKLLDKSVDAILHQDVYTLLPFLEERTGSHLYQSGSRSLLWQRVSLPAMAPSDAAECILLMDLKYLEPPSSCWSSTSGRICRRSSRAALTAFWSPTGTVTCRW